MTDEANTRSRNDFKKGFAVLTLSLSLSFSLSLFALLSKKHSKVLEQATQSLRGPVGADDTTVLPDYVSQSLNQFTDSSKVCDSVFQKGIS